MIKLATWNVNSLKVRLEQVLLWLEESQIDILALQETKVVDGDFPQEAFESRGFHVAFSGQKTYNGVAIISRYPLTEILTDISGWVDPQRRILAATTAGIRLLNLYVPNGAAVGSDKYEYKLAWLRHVTAFLREQLAIYPDFAAVGDWNIAPEDQDVHDPQKWEGCVLVSPKEREAFQAILQTGLHDSIRCIHKDTNLFSWWDYRAGGFRRNHGLRIDHILLSDSLNALCDAAGVDVEPRRSERPSDHAPAWVSLEIMK